MSALQEIQQDAVGTSFLITVMDEDDVVQDELAANHVTFRFRRPDGTTFDRDPVVGAIAGDFEYLSVDGDLTVPGRWEVQAIVADGSGYWPSTTQAFQVRRNL